MDPITVHRAVLGRWQRSRSRLRRPRPLGEQRSRTFRSIWSRCDDSKTTVHIHSSEDLVDTFGDLCPPPFWQSGFHKRHVSSRNLSGVKALAPFQVGACWPHERVRYLALRPEGEIPPKIYCNYFRDPSTDRALSSPCDTTYGRCVRVEGRFGR